MVRSLHALARCTTFPSSPRVHQPGCSLNRIFWAGFLWRLYYIGIIIPFSPMPSPQSSLLPGHGNCVLCSEMRPSYLSGYPGERNLDSSRMSHSVSHNSFGLQVGSLRLQKAGFFHWVPVQSLIKVSQQRHCPLLQPIEIPAPEINGKFFLKRCLWEMYHPPPILECLRWMFSFGGGRRIWVKRI